MAEALLLTHNPELEYERFRKQFYEYVKDHYDAKDIINKHKELKTQEKYYDKGYKAAEDRLIFFHNNIHDILLKHNLVDSIRCIGGGKLLPLLDEILEDYVRLKQKKWYQFWK